MGFLRVNLSFIEKQQQQKVLVMKTDTSGAYRPIEEHTPERVRAKSVVVGDNKESWETNPFWEAIAIPTRRKRSILETGDKLLTDRATGVVEGVAEVSRVFEVDSDAFIKVYTRFLHVFFDISKNAQRLFEVVLTETGKKKEQDEIYLHPKTAERYHKEKPNGKGYSQASFYRAVSELIDSGIIARSATGPNLYWINPVIFWNGDRIRFVTEMYKAPQIAGPNEEFK